MKQTFSRSLHLLRCCWRSLLLFELVYRTVLLALVGPVFKLALDGAMAIEGYDYLTHENASQFMLRPATILIAILVLLLIAMYEVIDIAALHYILGHAQQDEPASPLDAAGFAIRQCLSVLHPRKLLLLPLSLLLIPLFSIGVILGLVFSMETPELFLEHMNNYRTYYMIGGIVIVATIVVLFRCMFTYAFVFFNDDSFHVAARKSWQMGRGYAWGDLVAVLGLQLLVWLGLFALLALIAVPLALALPTSVAGQTISRETMVISFALIPAAMISGLASNAPTSCAAVLTRMSLRGAHAQQPAPAQALPVGPHRMALRVAAIALACICVAWGAHHMWTTVLGPMSTFRHDDHAITITAHRGGGAHAPENTLAAFSQAAKNNAQICELDVQMSKDGKIFVSHDSDFRRISKVNKAAWELTYDEVRALDATGEQWQGSFERQHYPLLDEVLDWATESGMFMNIELKPTGHEANFEQAVVDIVRAHDLGDKCIVTSQKYETVQNVKACAPELTCVYVTRFLYGDAYKMDAADIFSVEENSVLPILVKGIHEHGKSILAWTVNARRGVERAVVNGADSIITDDVPMAQDVVAHMRGERA